MAYQTRSSWMRFAPIACLFLVFLLTGCGQPTAPNQGIGPQPSPTPAVPPTPAATYTPAPATPLQWETRTTPAPLGLTSLAFSPLHSNLVWMCAPTSSGAMVWLSQDRAVTWQKVATVQIGDTVSTCSMTPDDLDPETAVLQTVWGACCQTPTRPYPMRVTHDSGKTWTVFNGPPATLGKVWAIFKDRATLLQISTFHGATFALFTPPVISFDSAFMVSRDGMQSWQALDSELAIADPTEHRFVRQYWMDPVTGNILAQTRSRAIQTDHFYSSGDGGRTWQDLHAPVADQFVVRRPYAATATWEICGLRVSSSTYLPGWPKPPICTLDGGRTWTSRSATSARDVNVFAIANDGEIISADTSGVFRASPSKGAWETLGPPPVSGALMYFYQPGAGSGTIWALPQPAVDEVATRLYVASYA